MYAGITSKLFFFLLPGENEAGQLERYQVVHNGFYYQDWEFFMPFIKVYMMGQATICGWIFYN